MNITAAFPSKNLKAADLEDGDMVLTMTEVKIETVGQGKDAEDKPILYFEETEKSLVLNKTNAGTIANLYGADTDNWTGQKITLFQTPVQYGSETMMGIRVHPKKPASTTPAKAPAGKPVATVGTPAPTNASPRTRAWTAFCNATPNIEDPDRPAMWAAALAEDFPGRAEKTLTTDEWAAFAEHIEKDYSEATGSFITV